MLPTKKAQDSTKFTTDENVSEKHMSQWDIMRRYSRAHDGGCSLRQSALKMPLAHRSTKFFPTGSQYTGTWNVLGMSGHGIYTYNSGVVYQGDFEDGMFHGVGQFRYPDGTVVRGHFDKGVMIDKKIIFADGLTYKEDNWTYCKMPDRRFSIEYEAGIQPAGVSNITAVMPPRAILPGFYDTGDGVYDTKTKMVYKANDLSSMLRSPSVHEQRWIMENCRIAPITVMGPRPDLYEEWSVPKLKRPHSPPPAADTQMISLSRRPSSERGQSFNMDDDSEMRDPQKCAKYTRRESLGYKHTSTSNLNIKPSSTSVHSTIIEKVKCYNRRILNEESHLKFTTLATNYSELFSQNIPIDVALAAVVQKPNMATFKYSDIYNNTMTKNIEYTSKKPMKNIPEPICQFKLFDGSKEFSDVISNDYD